jgi:CheY-like chemotaxis protein/DNA-binding XRE family transcriptional regulator
VLIVDDEWDVREYLGDVLRLEGLEVTKLGDPCVVIDRIRDQRFDLIVLDLMMPKLDGLDLLAQIRAFDGDLPVIMVTGYPSLETVSASILLGVSAYLAHPITPHELRSAVARIANKHGFLRRSDDELHAAIGRRIRSCREALGLTLDELACRTRLSASLLSQIERGETSAALSSLFQVATALGVRLATLFDGY